MRRPHPLFFAKSSYFLYYAAWACLAPFLVLFYKSLGFSGTQIGLLASITPLVTLFAAPFWGGLADATHSHKLVLLGAICGAGASVLAMSQARSYGLVALCVAGYAFFISTIIPLIDNSTLALLGERRDRYGAQRLWGAVGWGATGPLIGSLVEKNGLSWSFGGYAALLVVCVLFTAQMPIHLVRQSTPFWKGLRSLLSDSRWYPFLLISFLSGAGLSVINNFLFLYMDGLHASKTIMGLALTTATISEVPVLFFSGKMLTRFGPRGLLMLSLLAYSVRAYAYASATAPWQVLIIQLLHGFTFSTMLVAGVSFANQLAPRGMGATAQGLFSSTSLGLGGITGALVGGLLLDRLGGSGMYFWSGSAVLLGLVLFALMGSRMDASTASTGS